MDIKQFEKRVDQFAYVLIDQDSSAIFVSTNAVSSALGQWFIAFNPTNKDFVVQTHWDMLNDSIDYDDLNNLFTLIDYVRKTPVEKRGINDKIYYLRVIRYYTGPVPEAHYVVNFESSADYTKIIYGSDPVPFTAAQLNNIKHNDPALEEFIDSHKELVKEKD